MNINDNIFSKEEIIIMIYAIISKNDVPTSQMHIYLTNKTGSDGGMIPELFADLSAAESVNGLYAFAIGCVLTDNFTNISSKINTFPSEEVAILALIQYLKGMATTVQLNKQCVTPLYENLKASNILGSAPSLLNLDGDLFFGHYDNTKYFSKEAADNAEDSFPYWVINTVKEIKESNELVTPKKGMVYQLPYFIQNISDQSVPIYNSPNKQIQEEIGKIPSTGIEPVEDIVFGYGKLASAKGAYIELNDTMVIPIKHLESIDELKGDMGSLKIPETPFDIMIKKNCLCNAGFGITNHFYSDDEHSYGEGDIVTINDIFLDSYGIIDSKYYIELNPLYICLANDAKEHTKEEEKEVEEEKSENVIDEENLPFKNSSYLIIVSASSVDTACGIRKKIIEKTSYKNTYIDIDTREGETKVSVIITGEDNEKDAIKIRKKILSIVGVKAIVVPYSKIY